MEPSKRKKLKAAGWTVGNAGEFLQLTPAEKAKVRRRAAKERVRTSGGDASCPAPSIGVSLYDNAIDEAPVSVVTVSQKFQVVIPREIREALGLQPGQKVQALRYHNRVEFIPVRSMREMRGFLKGIDTCVPRDADRV